MYTTVLSVLQEAVFVAMLHRSSIPAVTVATIVPSVLGQWTLWTEWMFYYDLSDPSDQSDQSYHQTRDPYPYCIVRRCGVIS